MANINTVEKYVKLAMKKEKLEADLEATKEQIKKLEEGLVEYMSDHNMQKLSVLDRTVYLRREIWASLKDKEAGAAALKAHGVGWLVGESVNTQRLSAWIRELLDAAGDKVLQYTDKAEALDLPEPVREQLRVTEKFSVRVTR
jgi:hypothetical protein